MRTRSRHLSVVTLCLVSLSSIPSVVGQTYPSQDIHVICAFPPGSGADIMARHYAEKLRAISGRTVVVENRPGANGNLAAEYMARSKPDGYTILLHGAGGIAASMSTFARPPMDVAKTVQLAGTLHVQPFLILVSGKSPYNSVAELTQAMKEKGAKGSYATTSNTGTVVGEMYKQAAGLETVAVSYKAPADTVNDLVNGQVDFSSSDAPSGLAQERTGRLRIIATTTAKRTKNLSHLSTMTEQGVPMDVSSWWAPMVPAGTPRPVLEQINKWFAQIVTSPDTYEFLRMTGADPLVNSVDKAQQLFIEDIEIWRGWVKAAKIEPQG